MEKIVKLPSGIEVQFLLYLVCYRPTKIEHALHKKSSRNSHIPTGLTRPNHSFGRGQRGCVDDNPYDTNMRNSSGAKVVFKNTKRKFNGNFNLIIYDHYRTI